MSDQCFLSDDIHERQICDVLQDFDNANVFEYFTRNDANIMFSVAMKRFQNRQFNRNETYDMTEDEIDYMYYYDLSYTLNELARIFAALKHVTECTELRNAVTSNIHTDYFDALNSDADYYADEIEAEIYEIIQLVIEPEMISKVSV